MKETPNTVLIVGAGPTGMMAALELSRFGIPVRLIEKTAAPATTSRAIGVQARTLELLEQRGLAAALVEQGNKGVGASIYGGGKRVFRLDYAHIDSKYAYTLFVSQAETEKVLRDALERASVQTERRVSLIAFAQSEQNAGVTAVLQREDGALEEFTCAYMIDAEGAHSIARATLGLHFEGKSLSEHYALGDLHLDSELAETDLNVFSSEFGFMGLFPMGNHRFRLIASNPISEPAAGTAPSLEELQQIYDQRSPIVARFRDMSWSSWFHINSRMIHQMHVGRVFLGGDSAHIHSPAGAQGMNTGMQDMINLTWKLAMVMKGEAKPELLETYSADRIPIIANVLTKTEGLTETIGTESTLFRSVFNHIAPWVVNTDFVQQNSTERMSQLSLNYRKSPLSVSHGHASNLHAGDRLPDMAVTVLNRGSSAEKPEAATVFGLLGPSAFTMLFSNLTNAAKTHAEIRSAIGPWHDRMRGYHIAATASDGPGFERRFGTTSSILLIRPDGYIAFTGTEKSIPELAKYCETWLMTAPLPANQEMTHV